MAVNPYVNKVQLADGTTVIDISDTTAAAADVASGKYFYTAAGQKTEGTSSGGGGGGIVISDTADAAGGTVRTITAVQISGTKQITQNGTGIDVTEYAAVDVSVQGGSGGEYTRTVIAPQQTVSGSNPQLTHSGAFADGDYYVVTLDGTEYICTAESQWSGAAFVIGELQWYYGTPGEYNYPFVVGYEIGTGSMDCVIAGSGSHTIKVEHLEFPESGTTLVSKSITANGTYDPADDDADGYSSVTVAMPSGSATAPASISGTSATVSTGTNTLTLTKTVSVTPSVTAGYVSSGTAGNSSVSLQAAVTTKGAATIHPSTSDQTIASGTYTTGAQTIKAVTLANLTADNIKSGVTVTVGDSTDADCVASVTGTYSGGSSKAIYMYQGLASRTANSYGSTSATVTVAKAGTYNISYVAIRGSSSGTMGTNLHIGATEKGNQQTFNNGTYGQYVSYSNQSIAANTAVTIYATSGSNSRSIYVGQLIVEEV